MRIKMLVAFVLSAVLAVNVVHARLMYMELNSSAPFLHSSNFDNQHIVFVGDSLLRYQYLSLAYMVHHGVFYPDNSHPNILVHETFQSWIDYYEGSNSVFGSHEYCDCFRQNNRRDDTIYENRYYFNKKRNITISYIQYFGDTQSLHGHWSPEDRISNHEHYALDHEFQPYRWYYSIGDALVNIASKLTPKPSVLLLNAGHWPNRWGEESHRQSVLSLAVRLFDRVIWKTTNALSNGMPGPAAHEEACAFPGVECMNIDWTKYLSGTDYVDAAHFQPPIFTDLNIQFVHQLITKKPFSVGPMGGQMHGHVVVHKDKEYVVDKRGILRPFDVPVEDADNKTVCGYATRIKAHMQTGLLLKHLSGEYVRDICTFDG